MRPTRCPSRPLGIWFDHSDRCRPAAAYRDVRPLLVGTLYAIGTKMGTGFWVKRFLVVAFAAFVILLAVELLKGHDTGAGLRFSATWAAITSAVYLAALLYRLRKASVCARNNSSS